MPEKKKKTYKVPVTWSMMGHVLVDADSPEEAIQEVKNNPQDYDLPSDGAYLEDSFEPAFEDTESVKEVDAWVI